MVEKKYKTLHDLEKIPVEFSHYFDWQDLARSIDGYTIFREMELPSKTEVHQFWLSRKRFWKESGMWKLPLGELLLVLFMEWRKLRFVSGGEDYDIVNSLLIDIAQKTGNYYEPKEQDCQRVNKGNWEEVEPFLKKLSISIEPDPNIESDDKKD